MSSNEEFVRPIYYRVVERRENVWSFKHGQVFWNPLNLPIPPLEGLFSLFGTSLKQVGDELRKVNGGKQGYYLANILDKKYYYCGTEWKDVKIKLLELGMGRPDPFDD